VGIVATETGRRQTGRVTTTAPLALLQLLVGLSATGGGLALIVDPSGARLGLRLPLLAGSPFKTYRVPGLVLFLVIGLGHLQGAFFTWRMSELAGIGLGALGILLTGWILLQTFWIGWLDRLQTILFTIGMAELLAGPVLLGGPARMLDRRFHHELAALRLVAAPGPLGPVTERDLAGLPVAARRYLHFMGVVGRPRDWSLRTHLTGRFRPDPRKPWMACECRQYSLSSPVTRIFHIGVRFNGLPVIARDIYHEGRGRMLIRPLDLFTIQDATGPELDTGELVTWLNDAILMAPSMLLDGRTRWTAVTPTTFAVTFTDGGRTVAGEVSVDHDGEPTDFSTTDRYVQDPRDPKAAWQRTRWSTPVDGWRDGGGRKFFSRGRAIWHLPGGDLPYAEFTPAPGGIEVNVPPDLPD